MNRDQFWQNIDDAREKSENVEELATTVTESLEKLPPEEIISFGQHQSDLLTESYRWDLWAVAYIVNGGCSDDGFDYFRAWLMAKGSAHWKTAMDDPESVGEYAEFEEADFEDMLYVANDAYKHRAGKDFPYDALVMNRPEEPVGERWDEDRVGELYPALWEKFSE